MANKDRSSRLSPTIEDKLRAASYVNLALWGVVYLFFPPVSTLEALDVTLRIIWMSVTVIGAVVAVTGALRRVDIKMELPGLAFGLLGPLFYCLTQLLFVLFPSISSGPPESRYALLVYTLLPVLFALPRIVSLLIEARRLKKINTESVDTARILLTHLHADKAETGGDHK